jgi:hypothetical protein
MYFPHIIYDTVLSQPVTMGSGIIALVFTANIYLQSLICGLDSTAALSLLHNEVSYLNFI